MFDDLDEMFLKQRQLDPQKLAAGLPAGLTRRATVT